MILRISCSSSLMSSRFLSWCRPRELKQRKQLVRTSAVCISGSSQKALSSSNLLASSYRVTSSTRWQDRRPCDMLVDEVLQRLEHLWQEASKSEDAEGARAHKGGRKDRGFSLFVAARRVKVRRLGQSVRC
eukprot:750082-Hanusia_phi.AAC.1